jgi:hypothetical protein
MHSQPAVLFNRKKVSVAFTGILALGLLVLMVQALRRPSGFSIPAGILCGLAAAVLLLRFVLSLARPYLHLTDTRVTVYRGWIPLAHHHPLDAIQSAHTNRPETYIELLGPDGVDSIHIDLHPLDKADRIRFIFLVESSINRKFSHKHR